MGAVNYLDTTFRCPLCGYDGEFEFELRAGLRNQLRFKPGAKYVWVPRKEPQNGGRPPNGTADLAAYDECGQCGRDFFVTVPVRGDVLGEPTYDATRAGYSTDGESEGDL